VLFVGAYLPITSNSRFISVPISKLLKSCVRVYMDINN
jgi:hypothetical protein